MKRRSLTEALRTDHHYKQAGMNEGRDAFSAESLSPQSEYKSDIQGLERLFQAYFAVGDQVNSAFKRLGTP
jgi:hypothetical protein